MNKKRSLKPTRLNLTYAATNYVVYLNALHMPFTKYQAYLRSLRFILKFYGYHFRLDHLTGTEVLRFADIYDPFDNDPYYKELGQAFWKFIHWLKKNQMIPAWSTETEG
jgi:hypothetical protein